MNPGESTRDKGLSKRSLLLPGGAEKSLELQKLLATYARTDTDILTGQRMRSLQNQAGYRAGAVSEVASEFLNSLTVDMLNQNLHVSSYRRRWH